jgi:hypothetical protein
MIEQQMSYSSPLDPSKAKLIEIILVDMMSRVAIGIMVQTCDSLCLSATSEIREGDRLCSRNG